MNQALVLTRGGRCRQLQPRKRLRLAVDIPHLQLLDSAEARSIAQTGRFENAINICSRQWAVSAGLQQPAQVYWRRRYPQDLLRLGAAAKLLLSVTGGDLELYDLLTSRTQYDI